MSEEREENMDKERARESLGTAIFYALERLTVEEIEEEVRYQLERVQERSEALTKDSSRRAVNG